MDRDSLFGERIVWSGRPRFFAVPPLYRLVGWLAITMTVVSLCFAVLVGTALHASVGSLVFFAAWCATLALGAFRLPIVWQSKVEYLITEKHVIWRRGRLRRTIDRRAISYAHIRWDARERDAGDLVLVRAVPTGALRRTLKLTLSGVTAPDRLWAIVRGVTPTAPCGDGHRPLAQRLDPGERVLWSGIPLASPWTMRRALTACVAALLAVMAARMVLRAVPSILRVLRLHALSPAAAVVLVSAVAIGALVLVAVAAGVGYAACLRPARLARVTRYFVTDRRVLIRRGPEELHLDRSRIAYVISAPVFVRKLGAGGGRELQDVFLVLDGPQARALAPSGAFDAQRDDAVLAPVLASIEDAETVGELLRQKEEPLPEAA